MAAAELKHPFEVVRLKRACLHFHRPRPPTAFDHGVNFELATFVFDDLHAIDEIDTSMEYGEERSIITGRAEGGLLTVVYTMRGDRIRIISARKAEKHEHRRYHQGG